MTDPAVQRFLDAQSCVREPRRQHRRRPMVQQHALPDWDVRALVNHLVGEQLWAEPMLTGKTIEEVGDQYSGDLLGDDPASIWREAAKASATAFKRPRCARRHHQQLDGTLTRRAVRR